VKKKRGHLKSFASCQEITSACPSFFPKVPPPVRPKETLLPTNLNLMAGELVPPVAQQMQDGPEEHTLCLLLVGVGDIGGGTLTYRLWVVVAAVAEAEVEVEVEILQEEIAILIARGRLKDVLLREGIHHHTEVGEAAEEGGDALHPALDLEAHRDAGAHGLIDV